MSASTSLIDINDFNPTNFLEINIDPVVVHTIELLKYKSSMITRKKLKPVPKETTDKKLPFGMENFMEVEGEQVYEQAKSGVTALIFQLGFHSIDADALDTLTKVVLKKLNKLCHTMQILRRRLNEGRQCAQQVPVLQTLEHYNFAPLALHKFYHGRILDRRSILVKQCEILYKKRMHEKKDLEEDTVEDEETGNGNNKEMEELLLHPSPTTSTFKSTEKVSLQVALKNVTKPSPRLTKLIQSIPIPGLELEEPKPIQRTPRTGYLIQKPSTPSSSQSQNPTPPQNVQTNVKPHILPGSPVKSTVPQRLTRRRSPGIVSDTTRLTPASKRGKRGGFS